MLSSKLSKLLGNKKNSNHKIDCLPLRKISLWRRIDNLNIINRHRHRIKFWKFNKFEDLFEKKMKNLLNKRDRT